MGTLALIALFGLLCTALYRLFHNLYRISVTRVPGPTPASFVLGNLTELARGEAAETELRWQAQFGDVIKFKALFGEDRLLISDPKALQYIFQTSGYNFAKSTERRELARVVAGKGLIWADGDVHKIQRKIMLPGFSTPEAKGYLPVFSSCAAKMGQKWMDMIALSSDDSSTIDVTSWTSRCALDAIGEVAFDYQFGVLDDDENVLGRAYRNLLLDTFGELGGGEIFAQHFIAYLPKRLRELFGDYVPSKKLLHARNTARLSIELSKRLISEKVKASQQGRSKKDIMSLLVEANATSNERLKLNEEEMLGVMRVVILAGHETTANTFSWMLWELSRHPDIQTKLRAEIQSMKQKIQSRDDPAYTAADLDSMRYLNAIIKETLRCNPVVINLHREAVKDDVLPLHTPITSTTGEIMNALPVPKGLKVLVSTNGYNKNKNVWGPDAHIFDPERWLDSRAKTPTSLGVLGNLITFAGGVRSCLGWRFAVIELQAFMFEILGTFEFLPTSESQTIRREAAGVMVPTIPGQLAKGSQLPLRIRVASTEGAET